MSDPIKKDDFALLKHKRETHECISIYVTNVIYAGGFLLTLFGKVLKNNSKEQLTTFTTYPFSSNNYIFKKIDNKNEIAELSLIYKLHLLKES